MQIALIVKDISEGMILIDNYLHENWKVIHTCPMPSSVGGHSIVRYEPTCLVILEKEEKKNEGR